jgi:hypothetical protein
MPSPSSTSAAAWSPSPSATSARGGSRPWRGTTGLPAGFPCFRSQLRRLFLRRCQHRRGAARPWRGSTIRLLRIWSGLLQIVIEGCGSDGPRSPPATEPGDGGGSGRRARGWRSDHGCVTCRHRRLWPATGCGALAAAAAACARSSAPCTLERSATRDAAAAACWKLLGWRTG